MAQKNTQTRFVIFDGPQEDKAPGTRYISKNGSATDLRSQAAKFHTFNDAQDFAEQNHVTLNAFTYIGQEDFPELELQG